MMFRNSFKMWYRKRWHQQMMPNQQCTQKMLMMTVFVYFSVFNIFSFFRTCSHFKGTITSFWCSEKNFNTIWAICYVCAGKKKRIFKPKVLPAKTNQLLLNFAGQLKFLMSKLITRHPLFPNIADTAEFVDSFSQLSVNDKKQVEKTR